MTVKYEITNPLTGEPVKVSTFEEAKQLKEEFITAYFENLRSIFQITVHIQNEDESWTQYLANDIGEPVTNW